MPRLTPVQRKQALERMNAGQRPHLVAAAFNCNVRIIYAYEDGTMQQTAD